MNKSMNEKETSVSGTEQRVPMGDPQGHVPIWHLQYSTPLLDEYQLRGPPVGPMHLCSIFTQGHCGVRFVLRPRPRPSDLLYFTLLRFPMKCSNGP